MATHDYIIDNGTGAAVRSDLNNALNAIATTNSVSGDPATTYAHQIFHDTAASQGLKQRDASNAASNGLLLYRPLVRDGIYDPANVALEVLKFTGVASAVNELTATNAITGNAPALSATGDDTNINLTLTPKGTGSVFVPAGTATNPSISVSSDINTGLFFNAADTLSIVTGGTSRLTVDSAGLLQFNSGYGSVATAFGCRAWVNFNGTGTIAIRASGNVSSITDNGVGNYTVNFTTALPDANYAVTFGAPSINPGNLVYVFQEDPNTARATNLFRMHANQNAAAIDSSFVQLAVFR